MALLQLENVVSNYGSIKALTNVSFEVNEGEIVTLIGAILQPHRRNNNIN